MIGRVLEGVGRSVLTPIEELGRAASLAGAFAVSLVMPPLRLRLIVKQIEFVGVQSLPIILLTGFFTGAVFTLQSYRAFAMFGAQGMVGGTVGVALCRELGPTLTGLLVAGRAGSAMAAEIGAMRVSEQIDALDVMAVDPVSYLVKPRVIAATIAVPVLTAVYDVIGVVGSWFVGINVLGLSAPEFMVRLQDWIDWDDIWTGLAKAVIFGFIIGVVACYKGFYASGGAAGVGKATTSCVVVSSVLILVANYFLAWGLP